MNTKRDPRDLAENESSLLINMSVDAIGKIKTAGGFYNHIESNDGSTDLSEYIPGTTNNITNVGGYGITYFESDYNLGNLVITDTKHPGTSDDLELGTGFGNIKFQAAQTSADDSETTSPPEYEGG